MLIGALVADERMFLMKLIIFFLSDKKHIRVVIHLGGLAMSRLSYSFLLRTFIMSFYLGVSLV
jgi:hypothetical protein